MLWHEPTSHEHHQTKRELWGRVQVIFIYFFIESCEHFYRVLFEKHKDIYKFRLRKTITSPMFRLCTFQVFKVSKIDKNGGGAGALQ